MENKKIKNAKQSIYNNITFKSKLEESFYKTLSQAGFNVKYEEYTFILFQGFHPTVPFYNRSKSRVFRLDKTKKSPDKALHTNMYIIIKSLELLLENDQAIEMKSLIKKELDTLKDNLTSITIDEVLKVMGFDKDHYIV